MLADLLEKVAHHQISAFDAMRVMEEWAQYPWGENDLTDGFHAIVHFESDTDIRQDNHECAATMDAGLLERARRLRA
jgi:hypothetical protein